MKPVTYSKNAVKALRKMPRSIAVRIREVITEYADNSKAQANNVTNLKGREGIRLRVGDWRIIMRDGEVLAVLEVKPRRGAYD